MSTQKIWKNLRRIVRRPRIRIGKAGTIKLFLSHEEFFTVSIFLLMAFQSDFIAKLGLYSAFLFLVVIHELGHALVGAMCGWKTKALTFGVWSGLCEFMQDGPEVDDATHLRNDILVSWGGVIAELLVLLITVSLFFSGFWPDGSFFQGVFRAFTWYAAASVVLNLLPVSGFDGERAWSWIRFANVSR